MALERLDDLYRDAILEHRRNPRNADKLEDFDTTGDAVNPFCGDEIHLQLKQDDKGRITAVGLQGEGCSINRASGSMMSEAAKGKTPTEIRALTDWVRKLMQGDPEAESQLSPEGDLRNLFGVREYPIRIKCALLPWSALDEALSKLSDG
ncbi:MAG: SUF system NifU family Fe-S cluster assembly protein [SAR202 cluster bacterium Casp-Chloro-G4]|nr:SUF system NifU family Fe-S cluster assembly protein [Chloroflexota bacterium]MDA1228014.1 SUF system NifU family Fe-S cluster assembly protein [Chloroflexota bacterium]PKB61682.1 MAG: SUF system NifU family Fe-S cluster assembly protein [SAR202 cluster bacterium Casp-Chloro-G4]